MEHCTLPISKAEYILQQGISPWFCCHIHLPPLSWPCKRPCSVACTELCYFSFLFLSIMSCLKLECGAVAWPRCTSYALCQGLTAGSGSEAACGGVQSCNTGPQWQHPPPPPSVGEISMKQEGPQPHFKAPGHLPQKGWVKEADWSIQGSVAHLLGRAVWEL